MNPEHRQRVYELFDQAIERPHEQRRTFLEEACGDDIELRAEVASLLEHDSRADNDFLQPPHIGQSPTTRFSSEQPDVWVGRQVDGFHIKRVIAAGGMGTVYEAMQEQPQRKVALKVMKRTATSRSALRRFQFESEILGRLRHPYIAQVYQAGMLDDGTAAVPYFAMEYIPGAHPITHFAQDEGLTTQERLELFANVCDAVHHGHQKGIIHRDLKPANILVDAAGVPKVIDFGVARATDSDLSITTQQTYTSQLIGTVQYMSPEQCDADPHDLDTRSDVYSLGVVLYELLTGELPYSTAGATIYAATRAIKEQTPRRLSTIDRRLRGEVEAISRKALEKDRDQRYQSAAELALDVHRHLRGESITVSLPSNWTRIVRSVARNPVATATVAVLGVGSVFVAGIVTAAMYLPRLRVSMKPAHVEFSIDPATDHGRGVEARLLADNGSVIRHWPSTAGIRFAELVERPAESDNGKLLLLGFEFSQDNPYERSLCAYTPSISLTQPLWYRQIDTADVLPELVNNREAAGDEFRVSFGCVFDVFPEKDFPQYPGPEIVVCFRRSLYSQCVIQICDLNGNELYRVWHDGAVHSCRWLAQARLLVFTADCDWPLFNAGGARLGDKPRDVVVFALRPELDFIADRYLDYLGCRPGDPRLDPAWYLRLEPKQPRGVAQRIVLFRPLAPQVTGNAVTLRISLRELQDAFVLTTIDDHGNELPFTRVVSDPYKYNQALNDNHPQKIELPDPGIFKFVPMTMADVTKGSPYECPPSPQTSVLE